MVNRRDLLRGSALAAAAAATAPVRAQDVRTLKMVTSWPGKYPGLGAAATRFARRVEAASAGTFRIKMYPAGSLVHSLKVHNAVQEGAADIYHSADYYFVDKSPSYHFFCTVPFGLRPDEMNAWIYHGGGQALWDDIGKVYGIKHLPCGNTGTQMGGWFHEPLESADDFKGLRIRTSGLAMDVITALGGEPQRLSGSETIKALRKKDIDGAEWVGPWSDMTLGLHKVLQNYMWPGFNKPGMLLSLGINLKLWDSLTRAERTIFEQCAQAENSFSCAEFTANNSVALDALVNQHGVNLIPVPEGVSKAMAEATRDTLELLAKQDRFTRRVFESYSRFRGIADTWSVHSDLGILQYRSKLNFDEPT